MSVHPPTNSVTQVNTHFYNLVTGRIPRGAYSLRTGNVDIIIPVYNARELTEACISSVLKHSDNCRLLVVDDASSDPRIKEYLNSLQSIPEKNIEVMVLYNEVNLGFLKTVNDAYRLTRGHFVILNSDTEVPPGWLDRLFAPLFAAPDSVASVTPFSNTAMKWLGCNFPDTEQDNLIFKNLGVAQLDSFFAKYSIDTPIEIFSGVGFCMAFNRAVVDKIGLFDYETFGRGFCEEVDWSLRAVDAGYKHVLAPNLFVFHKFGASFDSTEKQSLQDANVRKLITIHGCYQGRKNAINSKEATRPIRDALAIIADAHTKGDDKWLAVLGGERSSWDAIKEKVVNSGIDDEIKGILFITLVSREQGMKLQILTSVQERIVYLPYDAGNKLEHILSFLGVYMAVIVKNALWPDSFDQLAQGKRVNCHYLSL